MEQGQIVTREEILAYINDAPYVDVSWEDNPEQGASPYGDLADEVKIEDLDHDTIQVTIKNSWGERTECCEFCREDDRTTWVVGHMSW